MKNFDLYIKFLNDLFDKIIFEVRYLPIIEKLDGPSKEGLVKKVNESLLRFDKKNPGYANFIRDYYFNPEIELGSDDYYNQAINMVARKMKKSVKETWDFKEQVVRSLTTPLTKNDLETGINEYLSRFDGGLKKKLKRLTQKYDGDVVVKTFRLGKKLISIRHYTG
mgnify:FL=1